MPSPANRKALWVKSRIKVTTSGPLDYYSPPLVPLNHELSLMISVITHVIANIKIDYLQLENLTCFNVRWDLFHSEVENESPKGGAKVPLCPMPLDSLHSFTLAFLYCTGCSWHNDSVQIRRLSWLCK